MVVDFGRKPEYLDNPDTHWENMKTPHRIGLTGIPTGDPFAAVLQH